MHTGGATSMQNFWPTNPDGTPKTKKGWPAGLAPGQCKQVVGSRGDVYTLKHCHNGGGLVCDCMAWCMQPGVHPKMPGMARTCKHWDAEAGSLVMKQHIARGLDVLGEDYLPKAERPEVIAQRAAKRGLEAAGDLYKPFKKQRQPADGDPLECMEQPADGGFFGKHSFALAFDLQGQSVETYWMSEKLDGVRAYWDGKRHFLSRSGNQFAVPAEVAAMMPLCMPLDGELWMGRGTFHKLNAFLKRKDTTATEWYARQVRFMVFDAPFAPGNFDARMAAVRSHVGAANMFVQPVHSERVTDEAAMRSRARAIAEAGGEGLMLREPHGVYRPDRTCDLLKVVDKLFTEAIIIGHNAGTGRLADVTGSLQCKLRSGKQFAVSSGLMPMQRHNPPALGTIVVIEYKGFTDGGAPRRPTFKGECTRVDVDASQFEAVHKEDMETEAPSEEE